jgi:hypothetical protein
MTKKVKVVLVVLTAVDIINIFIQTNEPLLCFTIIIYNCNV